jgi:Protein of unknown function (DUF1488)
MTLAFPNQSRSYDPERQAIHFLGHDGMAKVPFFIQVAALGRLRAGAHTEAGYLDAFDAERIAIQDAARKAYSHKRKQNMYVLTAADLP